MRKTLGLAVFLLLGLGGAGVAGAQEMSGTVGEDGGRAFADAPVRGDRVTGVRVRSGTHIDAIQFEYGSRSTPLRGDANNGTGHHIVLGAGESIVAVRVWSGGKVDGLQFVISNANGVTRETVRYGNAPGNVNVIAKDGKPITGVFGMAGQRIDKIGFYFGDPN